MPVPETGPLSFYDMALELEITPVENIALSDFRVGGGHNLTADNAGDNRIIPTTKSNMRISNYRGMKKKLVFDLNNPGPPDVPSIPAGVGIAKTFFPLNISSPLEVGRTGPSLDQLKVHYPDSQTWKNSTTLFSLWKDTFLGYQQVQLRPAKYRFTVVGAAGGMSNKRRVPGNGAKLVCSFNFDTSVYIVGACGHTSAVATVNASSGAGGGGSFLVMLDAKDGAATPLMVAGGGGGGAGANGTPVHTHATMQGGTLGLDTPGVVSVAGNSTYTLQAKNFYNGVGYAENTTNQKHFSNNRFLDGLWGCGATGPNLSHGGFGGGGGTMGGSAGAGGGGSGWRGGANGLHFSSGSGGSSYYHSLSPYIVPNSVSHTTGNNNGAGYIDIEELEILLRYDHLESGWMQSTAVDVSGNSLNMTFSAPITTDPEITINDYRSSLVSNSPPTYGESAAFTVNFSAGWMVEATFMLTAQSTGSNTVWEGPMGRLIVTSSGMHVWDGSKQTSRYITPLVLNTWYTGICMSTGVMNVNGTNFNGTAHSTIGNVTGTMRIGKTNSGTENTFTGRFYSFTVFKYVDPTTSTIDIDSRRAINVYPPAPLTSNTTSLSGYPYGNGQYIASASSVYGVGYEPYRVFDTNTSGLFASSATYDPSTGNYLGSVQTTVSGVVYMGHWIQIRFPTPFLLKGYVIWPDIQYTASRPMTWVVAGSTTGTNWTLLSSSLSDGISAYDRRAVSNLGSKYTFFRLIMLTNNKQVSSWAGFNQWSMF